MHPLSIVIAFGFLGLLLVVGSQLVVWSSRRLLRQHSPILEIQPGASQARAAQRMPLFWLLLALGLFFLVQGGMGVYRLIWVA